MKNLTMTRLTVSLDEETEEIIEENVGDGSAYESKSEFVRNCIQAHTRVEEIEREVNTLQDRLETREKRIDQLEQQLTRRSQIEEQVEEVALELREQREKSNAPFWVRWRRWWSNED
jgi:Arc/MetJ-type ribon-helix-helix transcriptional regulator